MVFRPPGLARWSWCSDLLAEAGSALRDSLVGHGVPTSSPRRALPSGTRSSVMVFRPPRRGGLCPPGLARRSSEVALALAVLHRRLGELVVGAGRAALGDPCGR